MRKYIRSLVLLQRVLLSFGIGAQTLVAASAAPPSEANRGNFVTNVTQFRTISPEDFLAGCAFRLSGTVTLVDTNRRFLVVQDETGAVGLHGRVENLNLHAGDSVALECSNCTPVLARFPDFPHHPSGWQIRNSFEAPINWGEYHLTRMRGYLHPTVSGQYTFWVASDNSSELLLSTDAEPAKMMKDFLGRAL